MNYNQNPIYPPANYQFYPNYIPPHAHQNNMNYSFYSPPQFNQYAPNMGNYMFPVNQQQFIQPNVQMYKLNYQAMGNPYSFQMDPRMNQVGNTQNFMMNINSNYAQNDKLRDQNKIMQDKTILHRTNIQKDPSSTEKNILKIQRKEKKIQIKTEKLSTKQPKKKLPIIVLDDEQIEKPKQILQVKTIQTEPKENPIKTLKKKIVKQQRFPSNLIVHSKRNRFPSSKLELQEIFLKNSLDIRIKRSKKGKQQLQKSKSQKTKEIKISEKLNVLKKKPDSKIMVGDKYQAVIPEFMFNEKQFKQIKQLKKLQLWNRKKFQQNYLEEENKIMSERVKRLSQELIHIQFSVNQYNGSLKSDSSD